MTTKPTHTAATDPDSPVDHDVAVVGGGAAGLAAAVFTARYGLETTVFDGAKAAITQCAHIVTLRARGWDAAALASMGGPSTAFGHAAVLTIYRARARDAPWLAARGETDRAAGTASDVFARFEGARPIRSEPHVGDVLAGKPGAIRTGRNDVQVRSVPPDCRRSGPATPRGR